MHVHMLLNEGLSFVMRGLFRASRLSAHSTFLSEMAGTSLNKFGHDLGSAAQTLSATSPALPKDVAITHRPAHPAPAGR